MVYLIPLSRVLPKPFRCQHQCQPLPSLVVFLLLLLFIMLLMLQQ